MCCCYLLLCVLCHRKRGRPPKVKLDPDAQDLNPKTSLINSTQTPTITVKQIQTPTMTLKQIQTPAITAKQVQTPTIAPKRVQTPTIAAKQVHRCWYYLRLADSAVLYRPCTRLIK